MIKELAALVVFASLPSAAIALDLSELVGYTLIAEKTVVGRIDDGEYEDGYEGCDYGRVLVFDDKTGVECSDYNYNYAYRPDAYIFRRGASYKIVIEDELMDINLVY